MKPKSERRGRPQVTAAADIETEKSFEILLAKSRFDSLREWADAANIQYTMFLRYARGENFPRVDRAARIAKAANSTLHQLYGHMGRRGLP